MTNKYISKGVIATVTFENSRKGAEIQFDWRYVIGTFVIVIVSSLLLDYNHTIPKTFDASGYWGLAGHFIKDGHFSLLNYDSALRGYLFPLLLIPFRVIDYLGKWPEGIMQLLLGAMQASLLFAWALPKLYNRVRPNGIFSARRRILFIGLSLFFWGGYFAYTLSDFPAILAFCIGLLLLLRERPRLWLILVAGILFGAALNTRPFYLLSLPFITILSWKLKCNESLWQKSLLSCIVLLGGVVLSLIPQWRINSVNFNHNSLLVLTKTNQYDNLFMTQLTWGLTMFKVETSLGGAPNGRNALVVYSNTICKPLLDEEHIQRQQVFSSIKDYVHFASEHPLEISATFLLHIFSGLDQHHATPYSTQDVTKFTLFLPIVNYTLFFIVIISLIYSGIALITTRQYLVLLIWLIPCSITIMVAMENRFLLPLHLLLYVFIAFENISYRLLFNCVYRNKLRIFIAYAIFIFFLFTLSLLIHSSRQIIYV
jgi:hypothetical protein